MILSSSSTDESSEGDDDEEVGPVELFFSDFPCCNDSVRVKTAVLAAKNVLLPVPLLLLLVLVPVLVKPSRLHVGLLP